MWEPGEPLAVLDDLTPLALHRGNVDAGSQARLLDYLTNVTARLPLPETTLPLFLHLHVEVPRDRNILHGYPLEPFLAALFGGRWFDGYRFSLVVGTKGTGPASRLTIGRASESSARTKSDGLRSTPRSAPGSPEWIEELRVGIARKASIPLPEGPVHLTLHLRCPPKLNWISLWKPAVDALGPLLGYDRSGDPHSPRSDLLTRVEFHRQTAEDLGNSVELQYAWRPVPQNSS